MSMAQEEKAVAATAYDEVKEEEEAQVAVEEEEDA